MPLFIAFEGPDGSGKSTQARLLADHLRANNFAVLETREPGGTRLGEEIRTILLRSDAAEASPLAMAFLLSASRTQLVTEVIRPALMRGCIVIADRFADSTFAYQAYGLGLDGETVEQLANIATGGLYPGVVVFVDVPPEVGFERVTKRGSANRLDSETLTFHQRVREGYLYLQSRQPERWIRVDGESSPEDVQRAIVQALQPHLEREVAIP